MIKKSLFLELKGLDEDLMVTYNDVDLCFKAERKGLHIVWTPFAQLFHYESKSRGFDIDDEIKLKREKREREYMSKKWSRVIANGDPYYNKNFPISDDSFDFAQQTNCRYLSR